MSVCVTLVHGTWGKKSGWTRSGSILWDYLKLHIADELVISRFEWTGRNSPSARARAGQELRQHLTNAISQYPDAKQFIVTHSHGGNVALYALRDESVLAQITGLVCLSTPFLYAQERPFGPDEEEILIIFAGFMALAGGLWFSWSRDVPRGVSIVGCVALYLLITIALFTWKRISDRVVNKFAFPVVPAQKLLVVRMSADEATGALVTSQFVTWILSQLWFYASNVSGRVRRAVYNFSDSAWTRKWGSRGLKLLLISILIFAAMDVITDGFTGNSTLTIIGESAGSVMLALFAGLMLFIFAGAASQVADLLTSILLLLVVLPISIAMLPFGPELVFYSFFVEITSETVPPGDSYPVNTFVSRSDGSLTHTQSYEDERVLKLIVDWINERQSSPVVREMPRAGSREQNN